MSPVSIYALHGFLGLSRDWVGVFNHPEFQNHQVIRPSFFSDSHFADLDIQTFIDDVRRHQEDQNFSRKIFVGYSLGGRLGLQLLEAAPDLFDHYFFVSTHPGLQHNSEKNERLKSDKMWLDQLQKLPWEEFVQKWNAQGVLTSSSASVRASSEFIKTQLEKGLTQLSLGHQKDYSSLIQKHQNKITWVVGQKDSKFLSIADDLQQKKILLNMKRIFSGHRILVDAPKALQELLLAELKLVQE